MSNLWQRLASVASAGRPKKLVISPVEPPPPDPQIAADHRIGEWLQKDGCEDFLQLLERERRIARTARRDAAVQASHIALMKAMTSEDTYDEIIDLIRAYQKKFARPGHASDLDA